MSVTVLAVDPVDFKDQSTGPAHSGHQRVRFQDAAGVWDGYRDGAGVCYRGTMLTASTAFSTDLTAKSTTFQADATTRAQFLARCKVLAVKAAAHAKDPITKPPLTPQETNEAIARAFKLLGELVDV